MVVQRSAPRLTGPALSAQHWLDLSFLHWPVEPDRVRAMMPAGVVPDVVDGETFVGLVPFRMHRAGPGGRFGAPYFGDFCETNVRLYSVDEAGRSGIVFLTLESARLATVVLARNALGLPYTWSRMRARRSRDVMSYTTARRWPKPNGSEPTSRLDLRVGGTVELTPLEVWLTSRWGLHTRVAGRTLWVPNEHPPWPIRSAEVLRLDDDLVSAMGVKTSGPMLRPLFSSGVRTTFGLPTVVSR